MRLFTCLALYAICFSPLNAHADSAAIGEFLLGLRADSGPAAEVVKPFGRVQKKLRGLRAYRIKLHAGMIAHSAMERLRARRGVEYVEPNWIRTLHAVPDDPSFSQQYGPQRIQADSAWDIWRPSQTAIVAIIDTGVDSTHPDLINVLARDQAGNVLGYNAINPAASSNDDHGHGSHVAGITAAEINNGIGIAGVAGWNPAIADSRNYVKVMPIKVLTASGSGNDGDIAEGITWAVDHGARVISMSLGTPTYSATLNNAVQYAWNHGVVVIASAGNSGDAQKNYPAGFDNVLSVAATNAADTLTSFSTYGNWVDIAAPGQSVYSLYKNGGYATMSGTSMSAPHVAGEAAAIISQNPTASHSHVVDLIRTNVEPYVPYNGRTITAGGGRINVLRAVKAAGDGTPVLTALSLIPSTVTGTLTCQGTVYLGGPAATGGVVVSLVSANPLIASVPESISVPEGALSVTFDVSSQPVTAAVDVQITAATGTITESAVVTVTPPRVSSLTLNPTAITSPGAATATVTLDAPAAEPGVTVELATGNPGVVQTPANVTVAAGQTSAVFSATASSVSANTNVTLTASANGGSAFATLLVKPPVVQAVSVSPTSAVGGLTNQVGTVTLTGAAPGGGATINLSSNNTAAASVPASILIPAGESTAQFPITTNGVTSNVTVSITVSYGGASRSAYLSVLTLLKAVSLTPNSVTGGVSSAGKVELNAPAGAGGVVVSLTSSSSAAAVPDSALIPEGSTFTTFTASTSPVTAATLAIISASLNGTTRTANLTVKPAAVSAITLAPASVVGGYGSTATVTLNGNAAAGGTVVNTSANNAAATVPASVTVPAGQRTVTFPISTSIVTTGVSAAISASAGGVSRSAYLSIVPVGLVSLSVSPSSIKGGNTATGTITLNAPANAGGAVVTLASNHIAASVPASVTVSEGQSTVTFSITTSVVTANRLVTFTASYRGVNKTATLVVTP